MGGPFPLFRADGVAALLAEGAGVVVGAGVGVAGPALGAELKKGSGGRGRRNGPGVEPDDPTSCSGPTNAGTIGFESPETIPATTTAKPPTKTIVANVAAILRIRRRASAPPWKTFTN